MTSSLSGTVRDHCVIRPQNPLIMPILGVIFQDIAFSFSLVISGSSSVFITFLHVPISLFYLPQAPSTTTTTSWGITGIILVYLHISIGKTTGYHPICQL